MNYGVIRKVQGAVLVFEAAFFILPVLVSIIYHESAGFVYLGLGVIYLVVGYLLFRKKLKNPVYYAKDGLAAVAIAWIVISMTGALPFVISGDIPSYTDALFETISGFTTTGSSILSDVEALSHTNLFWRSFTHWVGGMGVIVFILAVIPMTDGGYNMHLMRAESPGPSVGKFVPKIRQSSFILYAIYFGMTLVQIVLLLIAGMPAFDALCITFGSAGTGGFSIRNSGCADYSILQQVITTIFMILFGVNFNAYYMLFLRKDKKDAFRISEVQGYFAIIAFCIVTITINIRGLFSSVWLALEQAAFQVGSIITTTGYATTDFNKWPQYSRCLLVLIMFIGACAGSTGGGIKVSRVMVLAKSTVQEIHHYVHPRSVSTIKMDGKTVDKSVVHGIWVYLATYMMIFSLSVLAVSALESCDLVTTFTSVAATFNNIGPGLNLVGPSANFGFLHPLSKYILMFDMLAGRLELYPMLILFVPSAWRRK